MNPAMRPLPDFRLQTSNLLELGADSPAGAHDDLRQRLDVRTIGVEVHDAGAQHIAVADDGVGDERFAAALQSIEQRAIESVEMAFGLLIADASTQIRRYVAEGGDAQLLRHELQLGASLDGGGQRA